uniref:Uncharacterized protein n=3 Tax=Sphaerodactylus townsendi TaxID=933632 RepID=A0ACB8FEM0_9SAUR
MRDRETAATIRDVEVQEMELAAQRRLFEQKLVKEKETATQEVQGELNASRRKADLEDRLLQRLMETEQEGKRKAHLLAEEHLAKTDQERIDADWHAQVLRKQRLDDLDREAFYQELAKHLQGNRAVESELLDTLRETEAKRWEEVLEKREQVAAEQAVTAALDANRKRFLEHEMNDALELAEKLQNEDDYFERLRDLRASQTQQGRQTPHKTPSQSGNVCLNDSSAVDSHVPFSLDRGRQNLESRERELMGNVRQLRQKLMSQARAKYTPPPEAQWSS